jgi:UDP-glucose 4-epimerase
MIDIEQAIDLIEYGLAVSGYNVIPKLSAFKIQDLFEIFQEEHGLQYDLGVPRISEKLHEMMVSKEEATRVHELNETFYMHYKNIHDTSADWEFTSDQTVVTKEQLKSILEIYNYFKP